MHCYCSFLFVKIVFLFVYFCCFPVYFVAIRRRSLYDLGFLTEGVFDFCPFVSLIQAAVDYMFVFPSVDRPVCFSYLYSLCMLCGKPLR